LRYWEQQFTLLKPLKRSGGRRYYRPADVAMVEAIDRLVHDEGYTLKGAEAVLRSSGVSELDRRQEDRRMGDRRAGERERSGEARSNTPLTPPTLAASETIARLKGIRSRLARAIAA